MTKFADIKGFVFDLDGVITDTSVLHGTAWHQLADYLGVAWNTELANGLKGISRMDSLEMILKAGGKENDYTQAQKEELAAKKNTNYVAEVDKMTPANILPGMKAFLDDLRAKGYLLSLASASKNAPRVLSKLELADYFPKVVDPASLTHGKPDPEIYTKGAELLNLPASQCIGVEDAAAGVQAINAAGEVSLGIGDAKELGAADMVFANTADVTLANIEKALG
ncbi:beta-phosphoglucomutase [Levilactobacillus tujiorum]|uniref:beta-phosphoglucomutase n=1 Tax=Levilactobacillus tujiorum TaxID=2912243 RepID=UPI00145640B5|nr:beta-phosphoglucomutase [Levilactobacillus tujiorum]NLR32814.1 beta-phosphoglucomutase [Levilactobacillus tujiorum]